MVKLDVSNQVTKKNGLFSVLFEKNPSKSLYVYTRSVTYMRFFAIALSCHLDFRCIPYCCAPLAGLTLYLTVFLILY